MQPRQLVKKEFFDRLRQKSQDFCLFCKCKMQNSKFKINRIDDLAECHFAAVLYAVIVISVRINLLPGRRWHGASRANAKCKILNSKFKMNRIDNLAECHFAAVLYAVIHKDSLPCHAEMLDLINFELFILNFEL